MLKTDRFCCTQYTWEQSWSAEYLNNQDTFTQMHVVGRVAPKCDGILQRLHVHKRNTNLDLLECNDSRCNDRRIPCDCTDCRRTAMMVVMMMMVELKMARVMHHDIVHWKHGLTATLHHWRRVAAVWSWRRWRCWKHSLQVSQVSWTVTWQKIVIGNVSDHSLVPAHTNHWLLLLHSLSTYTYTLSTVTNALICALNKGNQTN